MLRGRKLIILGVKNSNKNRAKLTVLFWSEISKIKEIRKFISLQTFNISNESYTDFSSFLLIYTEDNDLTLGVVH